jgi:hypothetical protein
MNTFCMNINPHRIKTWSDVFKVSYRSFAGVFLMRHIFLSFGLLLVLTPLAYGKRKSCMPKIFPVSELVGKIQEIKLVAPYSGINRDLAIMHMIGSVHETYTICRSSDPNKWGHFMSIPRKENAKMIFWDGVIRDRTELTKALVLLSQDNPKEKELDKYKDFYLGWINERLGNKEEAIMLLEKNYQEESVNIDKYLSCKFSQCPQFLVTVESLKFLLRIYEEKNDMKKIEELKSLIDSYERNRVSDEATL